VSDSTSDMNSVVNNTNEFTGINMNKYEYSVSLTDYE